MVKKNKKNVKRQNSTARDRHKQSGCKMDYDQEWIDERHKYLTAMRIMCQNYPHGLESLARYIYDSPSDKKREKLRQLMDSSIPINELEPLKIGAWFLMHEATAGLPKTKTYNEMVLEHSTLLYNKLKWLEQYNWNLYDVTRKIGSSYSLSSSLRNLQNEIEGTSNRRKAGKPNSRVGNDLEIVAYDRIRRIQPHNLNISFDMLNDRIKELGVDEAHKILLEVNKSGRPITKRYLTRLLAGKIKFPLEPLYHDRFLTLFMDDTIDNSKGVEA